MMYKIQAMFGSHPFANIDILYRTSTHWMPPLWVWAVVVGALIGAKFAYRWVITRQLARDKKTNIVEGSGNKVD
jgi:hypothetical protein